MFVQHSYDFRRFDPKASNLDLFVNSAEKRDLAIGQITTEIACPEKTCPPFGIKGVGDEPFYS